MRPITRTVPPLELTESKKAELTERYKSNKRDAVWNQPYIRKSLANMSQFKCAYCEVHLNEKSMYMEVEHFLPKSIYNDLVVEWDNLLPCCKHCNVSKSGHDPKVEPIVNPTLDTPNQHLELYNYRFVGLDNIGTMTIGVLNLNDYRNVWPRFLVGEGVMKVIDEVSLALFDYARSGKVLDRNRATSAVRGLLAESSSQSAYSVVVATSLAQRPKFRNIRLRMMANDLWDDEFEQSFQDACRVACDR